LANKKNAFNQRHIGGNHTLTDWCLLFTHREAEWNVKIKLIQLGLCEVNRFLYHSSNL